MFKKIINFFSPLVSSESAEFVGTCWDTVYAEQDKTLISTSDPQRYRRDFEDLIFQKAKTLSEVEKVAELYSATHAFWSEKVLAQLIENDLNMKAAMSSFNQTCKDSVREFFITDFFDILAGWFSSKHNVDGKTMMNFIWSQSSWGSIVASCFVLAGWIDQQFARRLAFKWGLKRHPSGMVSLL